MKCSRFLTYLIATVLAVLGLGIRPAAAQAQAGALPASALQQINELLAEKEGRSQAQRKVSSGLLFAAKAKQGLAVTANVKALALSVPLRDDGRADVDIVGDISKSLIEAVEQAGGEVLNPALNGRIMRAAVPLEAIEGLASFNEVRAIHPALTAITQSALAGRRQGAKSQLLSALGQPRASATAAFAPNDGGLSPVTNAGAVTSQGSVAMGAERARKFFGVNGAGVKIGVLSDSDDFKEQSIATGDLPPDTVTLPGQSGRPGSGEGTAMMEIVHDVAPGAQLFFATAFNSPESFADNIRTLRFTYHADIIVDDILYYFESPYQDDIIAQAVQDVVADGAMYFSSAGNEGNRDHGTSGVWEGDFKSGGTFSVLPSGYTVHQFARGVIADRIEVGGGPVILHWSDPGTLDNPQSSNDYDLFVLTPDLRSVAVASTDIQDGNDIPFEFLGFNIPSEYQVVVAKKAGSADRAIRVQIFAGELALATDGNTYGHNSVTEAFGVAAADVFQANGGEFTGGPTTQVELYSSDGNRRVFYNRDGTPIGNGPLFALGGGETRRKPDITGADGVLTTLPSGSGLNPFFGTSAAAPHVAAIAGLLKSAKPYAGEDKIGSSLTKSATDIEGVGRDKDSGFGIANAFNALSKIGATPMPFLELGPIAVTPTSGDGDAFLEPGENANLSVTLLNNGGGAANSLLGTITTSTPGVSVLSGASPWPNLPSGAAGANTVPFAFGLSSSAACGVRAAFNLTTTFTGPASPKTFAFSVPTGSPSSTPSTFSFTGPRAAIPDNNPAGVDVVIPVAQPGAISNVTLSIDGTTCNTSIGSSTVGLDHTWVGDLVMTLKSPSGTTVTLFSRPGGTGNSGNNFCQTVFSDSAVNSIQNVTIAQAPYTGTFKPASPLSAFNGESASGNWTVNVSDNASADVGGVRAVSLNLSGYSCAP